MPRLSNAELTAQLVASNAENAALRAKVEDQATHIARLRNLASKCKCRPKVQGAARPAPRVTDEELAQRRVAMAAARAAAIESGQTTYVALN